MSINFASFSTQTYIGSPFGQPIAIGQSPKTWSPAIVRVDIPWASYGADASNQQVGVSANLFQQGQSTSPLDFIRSVFIDNTYVSVPVYVQFPDTLQTLLCPAYGQAMHPVYTFQQQFSIYGDGFQDGDVSTTRLFFSNLDRQGYYVPAGSGGSDQPTTPVILTRTQNVSTDTTGNFTFTDVAFGTEDSDRIIVLALTYGRSNGGAILSNAITIGGIAATRHSRQIGGGGASSITEIWSAAVPTGTTGSVVATTTGAGTLYVRGSVYAVRNLQSPVPLSISGNNASADASLFASVTARANGVIIACGSDVGGSFSWLGTQQNYLAPQFTFGTATLYGSTSSALTTANSTVNVNAQCRAISAVSFA